MNAEQPIDEDLIRRLPLPLAQLYRRAHNAKMPLERHLTAYYLWEASLKLLGSVAVIEYVELSLTDPQVVERLANLARPSVGHWWEFVRLLVPALGEAGVAGFPQLRDLVLGRTRDDLPRAASLDSALRETLDGDVAARSTVRLSDLFERLVRYRNRELGHGASGQQTGDFYARMSRLLLAGSAELLGRLDVLAGRRLVYVEDVTRQPSGHWRIERFDLCGEIGRRLEPLEMPATDVARLPCPQRVCLVSANQGNALGSEGRALELHPLMLYDTEVDEALFLNARRGRQRTEYLSYSSGRLLQRPVEAPEPRALLSRALDLPSASETGTRELAALPTSAPEPSPPEVSPGARFIGEFELLSKLGQGGMGVVYRAWQPSLGRQVALKALMRSSDPKAETRFAREIRALGRVDHPHLVKIFTSGTADEQLYYAMELVEGATLSALGDQLQARTATAAALNLETWHEVLQSTCAESRKSEKRLNASESGPTSVPAPPAAAPPVPGAQASRSHIERVAELMCQVADAAHALHEAGVIHRDIKPGNIIVTPDGTHAVLMDLGLAQLADEGDGRLTRTRQFVGTLRYASPEQVHSATHLDRRSDIYSLGVTLWELLALRPMYAATDQTPTFEVEQRIMFGAVDGVRKYNRRVPRDLEAIVMKCLEREPSSRYATARELADDLRRYRDGAPVRARPIGMLRRGLRSFRRRPARAAGVVAVFLLLGMAALGAWYWDAQHRLKVEYYAHYVNRWSAPEGIDPLSDEQVRHRNFSYRFYRRGNRVEKVETVNGQGQLTNRAAVGAFLQSGADLDRARQECGWQFKRNDRGDLSEITATDRVGEVVWVMHFTTRSTAHYADKRGFPRSRADSGAAYVEFTWSEQGFAVESRYFDRNGKPQPNGDGSFGTRQEFNDRGQVTLATDLGPDGQPQQNKHKYATQKLQFDERGNSTERTYLDAAGKPTLHQDGYARVTWRYDQYGNLIEWAYFGVDGQPTFLKDGYARTSARYDERGNRIERAYFDVAGQPCLIKEGYAKLAIAYDEQGNPIEYSNLGVDGNPTIQEDRFARSTATYDQRGNRIDWACFGLGGQPTLNKEGVARTVSRFDDRGNRIEWRCFGTDGKPVLNKDGYTTLKQQYDDYGNIVSEAYFDQHDQPTRCNDGYSRRTGKYDVGGNVVEVAFFDENSQPTRHSRLGYAKAVTKHDDRGNLVEVASFGVDGKPTADKDQAVARWTARHDARGNQIAWAGFGVDGQPTTVKGSGHAQRTATYDERGNRIEETYFDADGQQVLLKQGYTRMTSRFDARGNRIAAAFFDKEGKPTRIRDGWASWTAQYDERGNNTETAYFGADGKPTLASAGVARVTRKFDLRGNILENAYFGVNGQPTLNNDGYARFVNTHDERGNVIAIAYFDEQDQPTRSKNGYARATQKYDERGNLVEVAYFGVKGEPALHRDGYARFRARYDARGNRIEETVFGPDGKPALNRYGVARNTMAFDERGNRTELAYFGLDGRLTPHRGDGYAKITAKYNARGNRIEETYLNPDERPTLSWHGIARTTWVYDDRSNRLQEHYFGVDDKPAMCIHGVGHWEAKYDERGNQIEWASFGVDGKPIVANSGIVKRICKFDDRDNEIETNYFGIDGKPTLGTRGYARVRRKYDERDRVIAAAYFDGNGAEVKTRVVIWQVYVGSIAQRLGLRSDDVLETYGGKPVLTTFEFENEKNRELASDPAKELCVRRAGKLLKFLVPPGPIGIQVDARVVPELDP